MIVVRFDLEQVILFGSGAPRPAGTQSDVVHKPWKDSEVLSEQPPA